MLIAVLIILVCLALIIWALGMIPIQPPLNWIIQVLVIVIAVIMIAQRAGLL